MNVLKRMIGLLALVGIVATTSFAAPMCALCAPSSAQHHSAEAEKPPHDHCGAVHAEGPNAARVAISHCGHSGSICMFPPEREHPAVQLLSSVQDSFVPPAQVSGVVIQKSASPPPNHRLD